MTDNEIIKVDIKKYAEALNNLIGVDSAYLKGDNDVDAIVEIITLAKKMENTINRQKAEIAVFKNNLEAMVKTMRNSAKATRAEAIKVFAERLKATPLRFGVEYTEYYDKPSIYKLVPFVDDNDIDNLVKEMVGE